MIKFIHMADVHLGRYFNYSQDVSKKRRNELWAAFNDVCLNAKKDSVDFIFISGDLYEKENFRLSDFERLKSIFKTYPELKFLIISGNHDHLNESGIDIKYIELDNVFIFSNELLYYEFNEEKTRVYGYSWNSETHLEKIDLGVKIDESYNNILLLHCDVDMDSEYMPVKSSYLKTLGFDYIALGHIHKPTEFTNSIRYSGSLEPLNYGEIGPRGYVSGELVNGVLKVEQIDHAIRHYHRIFIEVTPEDDYHSIETRVQKEAREYGEVNRDFFKIDFTGFRNSSLNIDDLMENIKFDFFDLRYVDETLLEYDLEELYRENSDNIIGEFILYMSKKGLEDKNNRDVLYCGLEALSVGRN